jgi:chromosomal replication initiation ATPase DnaA
MTALPYFPPPVVIEAVAIAFATNVDTLRGRTKSHGIALARSAAVLLLREHTPLSLPELARVFSREHSFAYDNVRRARRLIEQDPRFAETVELARKNLVEGRHAA